MQVLLSLEMLVNRALSAGILPGHSPLLRVALASARPAGMAWRGVTWHDVAWRGMAWHGVTWQPSPAPCLPAAIPAHSQPAHAAAKGLQVTLIWLENPGFKDASLLPPSDMYWRKVNPGQHFLCYNDWFYSTSHSPPVTEGASLA